jgi:hypothetical protein
LRTLPTNDLCISTSWVLQGLGFSVPPHSPTLEGFRTIIRRPSFGFAEISWRWSFGAAAAFLTLFSCLEYLKTLPVSRLDLLLLKTRQPALVGQAMSHIFHGSGVRLVHSLILLALGLTLMWVATAALARVATVHALSRYFHLERDSDQPKPWRLRPLLGLNFFRVAAALAATVGCVAALLVGSAVSPSDHPAPGAAFLVVLAVLFLVWLAWSVVNWFLSLASVFTVVASRNTFGAIAAAVDLCRDRTGSVFAAGTWFGLAHIGAFLVATSAVALPMAFAGVLPPAAVLGGILLITLLYFAVADFLYMGRLAAYVAIIEFPPTLLRAESAMVPAANQGSTIAADVRAAVDQNETILSDIPLQN